jgi:hypothetical protein
VYAVRVGRQGEIFNSAAEARARFNALRRAGMVAGFVITPSLDDCVAWINDTPSNEEVLEAEIIAWASDDETAEVLANSSLE